ncbi:Asparaginyl-tRNA synthetase [Aphelenchoides avenae]|nr:Asparaginyl-tRNA synthetase [Aphelenchus avenae]
MISANDCEGGGETFVVQASMDKDFFGDQEVYLPVSSQLHLEAAAGGIANVYTLSPAFRAEKRGHSNRHLSEFRMLEAECAFVDGVDELCDIVEGYVKSVAAKVLSQSDDIETASVFFDGNRPSLSKMDLSLPFARLRYNDAVTLLEKECGFSIGDKRLTKEHEMTLVRHLGGPVFVTNFPASQTPFYMKRLEDGTAANFDLLAPVVGELVGGSVRENNADALEARAGDDALEWYIELRRRGCPPSGGFGLGIERFLQALFAIPNIKDTIAFPRYFKYLLVEVVFGESGGRLTDSDIYFAVHHQVAHLYGDYGIGCIQSSFQVKVCDDASCITVVRVAADACHMVSAALPFVVKIGHADAVLKLLYEGSSIRTVEKRLIDLNLADLYARLRVASSPAEKEELQRALASVTGSRVSHIRF